MYFCLIGIISSEVYSAVQINVVKGCVSAVSVHATLNLVYLDSRIRIKAGRDRERHTQLLSSSSFSPLNSLRRRAVAAVSRDIRRSKLPIHCCLDPLLHSPLLALSAPAAPLGNKDHLDLVLSRLIAPDRLRLGTCGG